MTYSIPNTITNGDSLNATPVQGNFDSIKNEINVIEATQTSDGAKVTQLKMAVEEGGWSPETATLTYASVDGPTQTATIATDLRARYHPGTRLKYDQTQAIQNYWSFDTNSADSKGSAVMANIGTPTYAAGKFGNALTLNGIDQALSITDAAAFKPTDNFTIGCWFKTSNTGAQKLIFQSFGQNASNYFGGIALSVLATNVLAFQISNNTASTVQSTVQGTTVVTDGNYHYLVISMRNNYAQLYLDGKLEASGYAVTPSYANTTNYVRIGCQNISGPNVVWFNGQIDDLFIAAYALDEQTIAAKYAAATAQGTGDLTLTKYALVTASSYSAPNTTVTIYSGTDHTMMNSTISNAYYSTQKAPYGFPLGSDKWSVTTTGAGSQSSPVASTWYNIGGSISVPIGKWRLFYQTKCYTTKGAAGFGESATTLSKTNNGETNPETRSDFINSLAEVIATQSGEAIVTTPVKTTFYLNNKTDYASTTTLSLGTNVIRATSTLL